MNDKDILDMYDKGCSIRVIADKYDTYPNKIRRTLLKYNRQLRDKSEAQKVALQTGRSHHPTKGKKRSQTTKEKISETVYNYWQKISEKDRAKRVDKAKEQWYNMSVVEREALRKSAVVAVRQAAKDGSKMEVFLRNKLQANGYQVIFHKKELIQNEQLEIDLFLPSLKTVIEIDGPSHFFPIWGQTDQERQENLERCIKSDSIKSGLLLANGFVVIRIKHMVKNASAKNQRDILSSLLYHLKNIEQEFPVEGKRYIELEVN